jgi:hypothetical protein
MAKAQDKAPSPESRLPAAAARQSATLTRTAPGPADTRPEIQATHALADAAESSPGVLQQKALFETYRKSPRVTAQLTRMEGLIGGASLRREREELPDDPETGQPVTPPAQLAGMVPMPNNTGLPNSLKSGIEAASGISLDNVKVHYGSARPAQLNAHAFAQGADIHVGPGQERHLPHEAWHVVQQAQGRVRPTIQLNSGVPVNDDFGLEHEADVMGARAASLGRSTAEGVRSPGRPFVASSPGAPVQRSYAGLSSMSKARVDAQAEEKYAEKSLIFEIGMAPRILSDALVEAGIDTIMQVVTQIVDAWATHTSKSKAVTYEREFGWSPGDGYYGAFAMTADNINQVLRSPAEPVRKRLKVFYNAVRNNNLAKWLKVAAIELDREAQGKAPQSRRIRTEAHRVVGGAVASERHDDTVTAGFATDSGLRIAFAVSGEQDNLIRTARRERRFDNPLFGRKRDLFGDGNEGRSATVGWKPETLKADRERRPDGGQNISRADQRTLERQDVPDITDAELDLILARRGDVADPARRNAFRANPNSKTNWAQGGEHYNISLGSESARVAHNVKARLEAGISGSTDLMIHAAQQIGVIGNLLKTYRLALAGWMIANRDHSFYEVLKAAQPYGLNFNPAPGQLYEDPENLYPMSEADFRGILPNDAGMGNVFPGSYLTPAYKDHLAVALVSPANTKAHVDQPVNAAGISALQTGITTERESAEMARLGELVQAAGINPGDTASVKARQVRRLRQSSAYIFLGNTFGEGRAEVILNKFLMHHLGAVNAHDSSAKMKLASAGIPFTILDFASPQNIAAMEVLRNAIEHAASNPDGTLVMAPITAANAAITLAADEKNKVFNGLLQHYHNPATIGMAAGDQIHASRMERMAQLEMIAATQRTSGVWYSWGNGAMLDVYAAAGSLRNATSNVPSAQGPGLYVARKISSSYTYGNQAGGGLLVAIMDNVPTIDRTNASQKARLQTLAGGAIGDVLETSGAYKDHIVEMLLIYGAAFGRLTTNKGVTLTRDLTKAPRDAMRAEFHKLDDGSKNNFRSQAAACGLNMAGW